MGGYDHKKIEKKWAQKWQKDGIYKTPDSAKGPYSAKATKGKKENFYLLVEFPYPSGNLHVGHWYAFAAPDILARAMRMQGKNVLYPIGFDAFGLPAENAAIKNKLNPRIWTERNIEYMTKQIRSMGTSFDWSREVQTIDPGYYKWTQWMFLQFFKAGLVYRKETAVNWCPKDKTVLANEQVVGGRCERCDTEVVQKQMLQWNIKITDYADRLIEDLDTLDWPKEIKESQKNWIGRSEGAEIDFFLDFGNKLVNDRVGPDGKKAHITVFTTRADTLFGATYVTLAPEHPWMKLALSHKGLFQNEKEVEEYVTLSSKKTDIERQADGKEKTGVQLKGISAINPATGKEIPVYVADYVLGHYGTGAVMGVPAHDERDFEFAKKFNLPIVEVIEPVVVQHTGVDTFREKEDARDRRAVMAVVKHWSEDKYLAVQYKPTDVRGFVTGGIEEGEDEVQAAIREVREETGYTSARLVEKLGGTIHSKYYSLKYGNLHVRFSPLLMQLENDSKAEVSAEEKNDHNVSWMTKQEFDAFMNRGDMRVAWSRAQGKFFYGDEGVLINSNGFDGMTTEEGEKAITKKFGTRKTTYKLRDWIVSRQRYWGVPIPIIHCPKCGPVAVKDSELPVKLPEVKDYLPEGSGKSPLAKVKKFVNVKCPQCKGKAERETDTLDTFVDSSWYFLRYTDPKNKKKFADAKKMQNWMPVDLYSGGAEHTTMHLLYSRFWQKALYDLGLVKDAEPYKRRMNRSIILGPDGQKMSKSRGNVIDPDQVVERLGADTVRMYLAFIGPYNEVSNYPWNPDGVVGVRRFLERVARLKECICDEEIISLEPILHRTIKKIGDDIGALKFNTAISQLMIFLNHAEKAGKIARSQWDGFIKLLAPFAPFLSEELWYGVGHKSSIHEAQWPAYDAAKLEESSITIAVQVNGKTRGQAQIDPNIDSVAQEAEASKIVAARLAGKKILRTIVVPGRLVNFVIAE